MFLSLFRVCFSLFSFRCLIFVILYSCFSILYGFVAGCVGIRHHLQDPSHSPYFRTPQVELRRSPGENVVLFEPGQNVSACHTLHGPFASPSLVLYVPKGCWLDVYLIFNLVHL